MAKAPEEPRELSMQEQRLKAFQEKQRAQKAELRAQADHMDKSNMYAAREAEVRGRGSLIRKPLDRDGVRAARDPDAAVGAKPAKPAGKGATANPTQERQQRSDAQESINKDWDADNKDRSPVRMRPEGTKFEVQRRRASPVQERPNPKRNANRDVVKPLVPSTRNKENLLKLRNASPAARKAKADEIGNDYKEIRNQVKKKGKK